MSMQYNPAVGDIYAVIQNPSKVKKNSAFFL